MKAIVYIKYGPLRILQLKGLGKKPTPRDNEIQIRIKESINDTQQILYNPVQYQFKVKRHHGNQRSEKFDEKTIDSDGGKCIISSKFADHATLYGMLNLGREPP